MPEGRSLGDWVRKVKGLRSTDGQSQNSHEDVKYSTGNIVSSVAISMYGASWVLEISGEYFVEYVIV